MTRAELGDRIEQDIKQEGRAHVPIGIIREIFSADSRASTTIDAALEEFASNRGWQVRHDGDLITPRVIFSPI